MRVYGKGYLGMGFFYIGRCVLRKWVVRGGRLDGYFGEQGLPVGMQECLERFHHGCVDYLSWQFVPKWGSPNCEGESATAPTASLLGELVAWLRSPLRVGCVKVDAMGNSRRPWVILNMAIRSPRICQCVREN